MIYKLYASDPRFRTVEFQPGLNVILAHKAEGSDDKDSRNGLGKTTLLRIIHFCLGADSGKSMGLPVDEIGDWTFYLELDVCGQKITASRSVGEGGIIVVEGETKCFPVSPERDETDGFLFYKLDTWKELLGVSMFGLSGISRTSNVPTFRALLSYFARVDPSAYLDPFATHPKQKSWQTQVNNAFLLGLRWERASEAWEIKQKDAGVKALLKALEGGIVPSEGELEAERARLQADLEKEGHSLENFKVHPQYQSVQNDADSLTREIRDLTNRNIFLRKKLGNYQESVEVEQPPDEKRVERLFEEAGVHFGESVKRTLADAREFHKTIVENRRAFLQSEIKEIENEISRNDGTIRSKTDERAEAMSILKTHGALEEFTLLQQKISEKKSKFENICLKIADLQKLTATKKEIKRDTDDLEVRIDRDYQEAKPERDQAVLGFSANSQALYEVPGNLVIDHSEKGYHFTAEIPKDGSQGVGKMKIFCYDLMLVDRLARMGRMNTLIHDSTMFDGVDSRQTAHALERALQQSTEGNFQYICALNSDAVPYTVFSSGFDFDEYVRLTLTDSDAKRSLLGFRYEVSQKASKKGGKKGKKQAE